MILRPFLHLLYALVVLRGVCFATELPSVFGSLPFTYVDDQVTVIAQDDTWMLAEVRGRVYDKQAVAYVVWSEEHSDVVYFTESKSTETVVAYFTKRWTYLADGLSRGLIGYRETGETTGALAFAMSTTDETLGSDSQNLTWNTLQEVGLRRFCRELRKLASGR